MKKTKKLQFDYSKLLGRIKEKYGTNANFASAMKMSNSTFSGKINNQFPFTQDEIYEAMLLLDIPFTDGSKYFFCLLS